MKKSKKKSVKRGKRNLKIKIKTKRRRRKMLSIKQRKLKLKQHGGSDNQSVQKLLRDLLGDEDFQLAVKYLRKELEKILDEEISDELYPFNKLKQILGEDEEISDELYLFNTYIYDSNNSNDITPTDTRIERKFSFNKDVKGITSQQEQEQELSKFKWFMKTKKHRGLSMIYLCLLFTPEVPVCIELDYFHKKTSYCRHYKETELFSDYKQLNFLKFVIGLYFILFYENNKIQNLIINIDAKKLKIFGETQSLIKEIKIANVKIIDKNIFTSEPLITKGGGTFDYKINVGATNIIDVMSVPTFNNIIRKLGDKLIFRDPTINSRKKYSPELELWFTSHNQLFNISIEFKNY